LFCSFLCCFLRGSCLEKGFSGVSSSLFLDRKFGVIINKFKVLAGHPAHAHALLPGAILASNTIICDRTLRSLHNNNRQHDWRNSLRKGMKTGSDQSIIMWMHVLLLLLGGAVSPIRAAPACVYDFPTATCSIQVVCTSETTAKLVGTVQSPASYAGHFANLPAGIAPSTRQYFANAVTAAGFSAKLEVAAEGWLLTNTYVGDGASKEWSISSGDWTLLSSSNVCKPPPTAAPTEAPTAAPAELICGDGYARSTVDGTHSCTLCGRGTYAVEGATQCTPCEAGKYSTRLGRNTCLLCGAGKASQAVGASSSFTCEQCSEGTYAASEGSQSCSDCAEGYHSVEGSSVCSQCPAGFYTRLFQGSCDPCSEGTFSPAGASACTDCDAGYTSFARAASCTPCAAGKFSNVGYSSCDDCPKGKYSHAGASTCTECAQGKYSQQAQSACDLCAAP